MKFSQAISVLLGVFFVVTGHASAQVHGTSAKTLEISETNLLGTWWVKHNLGGLDGYQMERNGKLTLVNLYSWYGDGWKLNKDTMTWVMYADKQKPETARYLVSNLTLTGLTLTPLTSNGGEKAIPLYKHTGNKATDGWVGRWMGAEGSYMDIIPDSLSYKIVIEGAGRSGEFRGSTENDRIKFTRKGVVEYITAGDGKSTGVKSLEKKKNCLAIKKGEGYYRD